MNAAEHQPLGYLLHRVAAALRAEVTTRALDPVGLTFSQYICLRMLSHYPGMSNADLARNATVSRQAMNIVLRELQDRGLVARPTTATSGRSLPAELTSAGVEILACTDAGVLDAERQVLARLSEPEQREFRRLLAVFD